MGNGSVIRPGEIQRMSAGTGVTHSEFNASGTDPVHFLQIWVLPSRRGVPPSYEQKEIPPDELRGILRLVASPDGRDGSVTIHQDAEIRAAILEPGETVSLELTPSRHAWVQVVRGAVSAAGQRLGTSDGAAVTGESRLDVAAFERAEVLLFTLS
jgi:redox-sensitive bicupin YhaK (pirin superfamily)